MTSTDSAFAGSIPEIYDHCLGPLLFEPYARDLASRAARLEPAHILETAAGTGIVTAELARQLPDADIVATDLNQGMIDVAASAHAGDRIRFIAADAQSLPFADSEFDLVICQFGVMFFPDRVLAYREARRVLRDGGTFLFNAWLGLGGNRLADLTHHAVAELFPDDPPGFLGRAPYGYSDPSTIERELESAGFRDIGIEEVTFPSRATNARQIATGFCQGSPLRAEIEQRDAGRLAEATGRATSAIEAEFGTGAVDATMAAHVVSATA
jgi:SAM-dependent methyltransferase